MLKRAVQVAFHLLLCMPSAAAHERVPIVLSAVDLPSYTRLYKETFRILNAHADKHRLTYQSMPNKRQFISVMNGTVDGIGIKTEQQSEHMPGLVKVPTPLFFADSMLGICIDGADITSKDALARLRVAILNGSTHSMNLVPANSQVIVNSHVSGLMMLVNKRVDAMSILDLAYYSTLRNSPELVPKIKLATLRERVPFYIYMHERKKNLIPELDEVIKKAMGEIQTAHDRIIDDMRELMKGR